MGAADSLNEWFEAVYKDTDCYIYIASKSSTDVWKEGMLKWPEQRKLVVDGILRMSAKGDEVYYSPVMWSKAERDRSNFLGSYVLWADFDGNAQEEWSKQIEGISDPPPEPSAAIRSSSVHNKHTYWLLEEAITDVGKLESLNKSLCLELGSDTVWDCKRILRPPETVNYGYGKEERKGQSYPVLVDDLSERRYRVEDFKEIANFKPLILSSLGEIPPITDVLAKGTWSDEFLNLFNAKKEEVVDRSTALMKLAFCAAEASFTAEQIYAVVKDADDRWGKYSSRTDKETRYANLVDHALDKYPTGLKELTFAGILGTSDEIALKNVYSLDEFMATEIHINWVLDGVLSTAGYGIIAGQPGVGKSQLGIRMLESIATGDSFLSWENRAGPLRTLFLSLEMPMPEVQQFITTMETGSFMNSNRDNFMIAPVGDSVALDREEGQKFLEGLLEEYKPNVLLIDSLAKAIKISDDDSVTMFNRFIARIRLKYGCSVIVIHHNRKSQDKRFIANELDDLYGSRFLSQDAQFVFMLYKHPKEPRDVILLNPAKLRFAAQPGPIRLYHQFDLSFQDGGSVDVNDGGSFGGDSPLSAPAFFGG